MSREVRMVSPTWKHPKNDQGRFVPLFEGVHDAYAKVAESWDEGYAKWQEGLIEDFEGGWEPREEDDGDRYTDWAGPRPSPDDFMPNWTAGEATHFMMYESTSEGTPISPAFTTPEELARYCADNGVSAFGRDTATYEQWLNVAKGAYAPTAVYTPSTGLVSGVAGTEGTNMSRLTEAAKVCASGKSCDDCGWCPFEELAPTDMADEIALMAEILELPDPEPERMRAVEFGDCWGNGGWMETPEHIAWLQRQEARKKLTEWIEEQENH